ncbi:MAG: hypothetical protein AVDCRST_MAG13-699, partial [uncultured Solirubrobacteraceae bacterium]
RLAAWSAGPGTDVLLAWGLGALLAAVALGAGGGLQPGPTSVVEIALVLAAGIAAALALLATAGRPLYGGGALAAFAGLAVLTGLSITWAVQPDDAWLETNRTLAYLACFAAGIALVRLAPGRWGALVGATVIAASIVSLYALATKVFPGALNPEEAEARLREPFGYWNAVGLMAALGVPGALWLAARRAGHAAVGALAYPVLGILLTTILLAYSRGALLAVAVGAIVWFSVVPLRLRSAAALAAGALGAILVALWAFGQEALSGRDQPLPVRAAAGHGLGLLLVVMSVLLLVVGLAAGFAAARRAPRAHARRQAGTALVVVLALLPLAGILALALSDRGLGGSLSQGWSQLTDPRASTPANEPGRLTAVGSVRARYYNEALKLFRDAPALGVGAGGYATARPRVRQDELDVRHAHGYLFQTAADLGIAGLAASLLTFAAWLWAVRRTFGRRRHWDAERVGLAALATVVVVFGVHSFVDWTWFVPGTAAVAMLCAGWVAGRGDPRADRTDPAARALARVPAGTRIARGLRRPGRALPALGVLVLTGVLAWTVFQPLRGLNAGEDALALLEAGRTEQARAAAVRAHDIDPLSAEPLYDLAVIESAAGRTDAAGAALERAVALQPQNPTPWLRLADFQLSAQRDPQAALRSLGPALALDPRNTTAVELFLQATRQGGG